MTEIVSFNRYYQIEKRTNVRFFEPKVTYSIDFVKIKNI